MRNLANFMTNAEKCRSECKQLLVEKSTRAFLLVEKKKKEEIDGLLTQELNIFDAKKALQSIADKQNYRQTSRDQEQTAFYGKKCIYFKV
jgi:hypothetical protein